MVTHTSRACAAWSSIRPSVPLRRDVCIVLAGELSHGIVEEVMRDMGSGFLL
jgi:hypothetical protein